MDTIGFIHYVQHEVQLSHASAKKEGEMKRAMSWTSHSQAHRLTQYRKACVWNGHVSLSSTTLAGIPVYMGCHMCALSQPDMAECLKGPGENGVLQQSIFTL